MCASAVCSLRLRAINRDVCVCAYHENHDVCIMKIVTRIMKIGTCRDGWDMYLEILDTGHLGLCNCVAFQCVGGSEGRGRTCDVSEN